MFIPKIIPTKLAECNESNKTVCFICKNFLFLYVLVNYSKHIKSANKSLLGLMIDENDERERERERDENDERETERDFKIP